MSVYKEQYPEHEKLHAVREQSQAIGEFLEWVNTEKGWMLGVYEGERMYPASYSINALLAEFFGIDPDLLEREKRAMLESLRAT